MGFRFRRSIRILPGVRINLSGSGASVSVGPRGLHYTVSSKGTRITTGLPGTGLSWTQYTPHEQFGNSTNQSEVTGPGSTEPRLDADETALGRIESPPASQINALSTSELAAVLNSVQLRWRFAPLIGSVCIIVFRAVFASGDRQWLGVIALYTSMLIPIGIWLDRYRRSVRINYHLEEAASEVASALSEAFEDLRTSKSVWNIDDQVTTADWKRHAGATRLNKRKRMYPLIARPSCIRGRVNFPAFKLARDEIYFLPDIMLVVTTGSVAAIHYQDLAISDHSQSFIEDGPVPSDADVITHTWRYVNKSGGPDRRFNWNRKMPVCSYGELDFKSNSKRRFKIQYSKPNAGKRLVNVIEVLRGSDLLAFSKPVTSFEIGRGWPSAIFLFCFTISGIFVLGSLAQDVIRNNVNAPSSSMQQLPDMDQSTRSTLKMSRDASAPATVSMPQLLIGNPGKGFVADIPLPRPRPKL
jgi:hypothetical protein